MTTSCSLLGQFIRENGFYHAESFVIRGFCHMEPLRYPPYIQVFHGTRWVGIGDLPGQLMQEVLAVVGNFSCHLATFSRGF